MGRIKDACMHLVPGPLKSRPKLAIIIACAGGLGGIGSGLAGFTDFFSFFFGEEEPLREDQAYITHQQFNTLIVPLVNNVQYMEQKIDHLNEKIDHQQQLLSLSSESSTTEDTPHMPTQPEESSQPKAITPIPLTGRGTEHDWSEVQQALERVQQMQQQQRELKQNLE